MPLWMTASLQVAADSVAEGTMPFFRPAVGPKGAFFVPLNQEKVNDDCTARSL